MCGRQNLTKRKRGLCGLRDKQSCPKMLIDLNFNYCFQDFMYLDWKLFKSYRKNMTPTEINSLKLGEVNGLHTRYDKKTSP